MKACALSVFWGWLIATEIATVSLFTGVMLVFHANPFGIYGNLIISLGGLIFGLLGGIGAYVGARIAGLAPTAKLYVGIIAATVLALMLYHFSIYLLALVLGDPLARLEGFAGFFDKLHDHSRFSFSPSDRTGSEIGTYGYGLLALDFVWAGIGSVVGLTALKKIPHCIKCGTYFRKRQKRELRFGTEADLVSDLSGLPPASQHRAEALMGLDSYRQVKAKKGTLCVSLLRSECPSCQQQSMVEEIKVHNGKGFVAVDRLAYSWAPTAATRSAPAVAAPVQGFGRKGVSL